MFIKPQYIFAMMMYVAIKNGVSWIAILLLILYWLWVEKGKPLLIIVCFILLFSLTTWIENQPMPSNQTTCANIVKIYSKGMEIEINNQRFASFDFTPNLDDAKVCAMMDFKKSHHYERAYVDPLMRYQHSNNIRGTVSLSDAEFIKHSWISRCRQSLSQWIFPQKENDQFWMIHHSGLWLTSFISMLTSLLHLRFKQDQVHLSIHVLITFFSFIVWDVRTVRLLVQSSLRLLKIPHQISSYIALVVVLIMFPFNVTSLAFLFPWIFLIIRVTRLNNIKKWITLFSLQQWLFASFSPLFLIMYGLLGQVIWTLHLMNRFINVSFIISYLNEILINIDKSLKLVGGLSCGAFFTIVFLLFLNPSNKKHRYLKLCLILFLIIQPTVWISQIHFINIGQGHSTLIKHANKSILIDTGKSSHYSYLKHTLNAHRIHRLDALLITHDDEDHSGSVDLLIEDGFASSIWPHKTSWETPSLIIQSLLHENYEESNEDSAIYLLQLHNFSLLITGDAYHTQERKLIDMYHDLRTDVLLVGHHGSRTSTHPDFIAHIQPILSIISAQQSIYGHPHRETLRTLQKHQSTIVELEKHGDVSIYILPWFKVVLSSAGGFAIMR
jgi:competence protein ComEC